MLLRLNVDWYHEGTCTAGDRALMHSLQACACAPGIAFATTQHASCLHGQVLAKGLGKASEAVHWIKQDSQLLHGTQQEVQIGTYSPSIQLILLTA